jgi:hypothetical protein
MENYFWDETRRTCLEEESGVTENHDNERQPDHEDDDHVPVNGHYLGFFRAVSLVEILPFPLLKNIIYICLLFI